MSSIQTRFTMFKHSLKTSTNIAVVCSCVFICCVVCSIRDIPQQCFHFIILFICLGKFLCKMMLCLSYNMLRNVSVLLLLSIDLMFVYATSDFLNGIPTLSSPQEDYVYNVCVIWFAECPSLFEPILPRYLSTLCTIVSQYGSNNKCSLCVHSIGFYSSSLCQNIKQTMPQNMFMVE